MRTRLPVSSAPEPLEAYAQHFDSLFAKRKQRDSFRRYLEGLLLPAERTKTLTAIATTEPVIGAQHPLLKASSGFSLSQPGSLTS